LISEIFDKYAAGALSMSDFDTELWHFLCERVNDRDPTFSQLPEPVRNFYASRHLEWEVGNGGFAQAAHNIPHLFEAAHRGYLALDLGNAAKLIEEAQRLMAEGHARFSDAPGTDIGDLFEEFAESALAPLDARTGDSGWWATERRSAYALANRKAFESVA
jgi:hypothetical protein